MDASEAMDDDQEDQHSDQEIVQDGEDQASSSSSSDFLPMDPLPESEVIDLPEPPSPTHPENRVPHPIAGDPRLSRNAANYTDFEYGYYYLGYTFLQPGVPHGVDSLLSIGNYGRRLYTFALNALNERYKEPEYYKPVEVGQWVFQQQELFLHKLDRVTARAFSEEDFKNGVEVGKLSRKTARSLPDLRSDVEISKPHNAADCYKIPLLPYPLRTYVYPEGPVSYEPSEGYAALSQGSGVTDWEFPEHAEIGSTISHIEAIDPFELDIDLNSMADRQRDGAEEEAEEGIESGVTHNNALSFVGRSPIVLDASPQRSFDSYRDSLDLILPSRIVREDDPFVETTDNYPSLDVSLGVDLQETSPLNDYRVGRMEEGAFPYGRWRDIVQRSYDLDWIIGDSDEEATTADLQEQWELDTTDEMPEQDVVDRLYDIDQVFEDSDDEDNADDEVAILNPQENQDSNERVSNNAETITTALAVNDRSTPRSFSSSAALVPLFLTPNADRTLNTRSRDGQTTLIPFVLATIARLTRSTRPSFPAELNLQGQRNSLVPLGLRSTPRTWSRFPVRFNYREVNNSLLTRNNPSTQHTNQSIALPVLAGSIDNSVNSTSSDVDEQEDSVVSGLRGGELKENLIKKWISSISSGVKMLVSIFKSENDNSMSANKKGKAPVRATTSNNGANIEDRGNELSSILAANHLTAMPRKRNAFGPKQEDSLSPESSHYRSPDALILSNGSIIPTASNGYATARSAMCGFVRVPSIDSSHGDIRQMVPLDINKPLPETPEWEVVPGGTKLPNSIAWIDKAFEISAKLDERRKLGLPPVDKPTVDTTSVTARLADLDKRVSKLESIVEGA